MNTPALRVDSLALAYPGATNLAVQGVSFELPAGEIACLLGPSGCGKTTLLRAIAGFLKPFAGNVWLADRQASSPTRVEVPEKRQVGVVFQDYALFPHLTVRQNIEFGLHTLSRHARAARAAELLALTGLEEFASRFPHELSGGQQQRVPWHVLLRPNPR